MVARENLAWIVIRDPGLYVDGILGAEKLRADGGPDLGVEFGTLIRDRLSAMIRDGGLGAGWWLGAGGGRVSGVDWVRDGGRVSNEDWVLACGIRTSTRTSTKARPDQALELLYDDFWVPGS